jgi:hypothetical protein
MYIHPSVCAFITHALLKLRSSSCELSCRSQDMAACSGCIRGLSTGSSPRGLSGIQMLIVPEAGTTVTGCLPSCKPQTAPVTAPAAAVGDVYTRDIGQQSCCSVSQLEALSRGGCSTGQHGKAAVCAAVVAQMPSCTVQCEHHFQATF